MLADLIFLEKKKGRVFHVEFRWRAREERCELDDSRELSKTSVATGTNNTSAH